MYARVPVVLMQFTAKSRNARNARYMLLFSVQILRNIYDEDRRGLHGTHEKISRTIRYPE